MVKLTDLQVASLLEEIACAMQAGTPVVDSMRRLESRRLGRVARAAGAIASRLDRGESVAEAMSATSSSTGPQAAAAIQAAETSGDPSLIERISLQLRERADFSRDSRLAWFYPWMLLLIGYIVAVAVMAPMIRQIHGRDFQWSSWVVGLAIWLQSNWWLPPLIAAGLFVLFLTWLFSRDRFPRHVRMQLFCNALADQFEHDVPEDVAIRAAAALSGDKELMAIEQPSLKSPPVAQIVPKTDGFLNGAELNPKQSLIAQLHYLGSIYRERARRNSYFWSRILPRTAMVLIGGGLTLAYAWWVIAPVYREVAQW